MCSPAVIHLALVCILGMEIEGLYRMSGKKNDILRLKEKFDSGK